MSEGSPAPSPRRLPRWLLPALIVGGLIAAYALLPLKEWLGDIGARLHDLGGTGIALYIGAYVIGTMLFFPAALLSLCAGFAWGALDGFAVAVPSSTIAALSAFSTSRYLFRGRFRSWVLSRPRAAAIDHAIDKRGPWLAFLLRFSPVAPFPIVNYAIGLSHIPAWQFALATFFGMMPITFLYTYTGSVARLLGSEVGMATEQKVFVVFGVVVTVLVTIWVTRAARRAMRDAAPAAPTAETTAPSEEVAP